MTSTHGTEGGSGTAHPGMAPTLTDWLTDRTDAELTELLRLRPDLAVPPPATCAVLAGRAEQRASVMRAADTLNTLEFGLLEVLSLEQADQTPVARSHLDDAFADRASKKSLDKALSHLRSLALVWGDGGRLRIARAAADALPWRTGRAHTGTDAMTETEIRAALAEIEPSERDLLTTLARSSPLGRTRDAAPGTSPDRPVQRLLSRGLLHWIDAETVELPTQVGQVLRDEAVYDPASPTPPPFAGRKQKLTDVNAAAAGEAMELIRHCEDLVAALGDAPAPALKAGGLGVRELRRLSKAVGIDEARIGLLLELLAGAGLIASGIPEPTPPTDVDEYWAPTVAVTGWLSAGTARRWATIAGAWLALPRRPWMIGSRDTTDKPISALSEEVRAPGAPQERRFLLELLADAGARDLPASEASRLLAWRRPRWAGRLGPHIVERMLDEARTLGLVAHGALSSPGKALLHGGDAVAELDAALPEPIDYVLVQADLTVVAPGPLIPELTEQITLVADVESAGAASMYRISESSIRRALDAGHTASELQTLFATRSKTPVPQSLIYLIDDVARRHGRLRAGVAASFIRCEDPALLAEVLSSPVADQLALRSLAPTVVISQAPLGEVLAELRAVGFAPAGEDSSGTLVDLRPRGARVPTPRTARVRAPAVPTDEQLETLVRSLRAGDRAAESLGSSGPSLRSDGTRASTAATITLLQTATAVRRQVTIGYVDAQGVASHRIVQPVSVGGGQLDALDPTTGETRRFMLHRITSVALTD
ncbi:helicase-associated domain-containing protein [Rhodococcus spongiicola]|uniref:DNA-binding protein n=1 Tax=Rhodococcus spongiicola TaxID=2487352 RepID=A0A3S3CV82_9NOCA|nr:helicase-associated domain-containing protein [Rhodococcus spongiicola]RVW06431.1 DNA-binding protein [Rhodococcus spongiicola]